MKDTWAYFTVIRKIWVLFWVYQNDQFLWGKCCMIFDFFDLANLETHKIMIVWCIECQKLIPTTWRSAVMFSGSLSIMSSGMMMTYIFAHSGAGCDFNYLLMSFYNSVLFSFAVKNKYPTSTNSYIPPKYHSCWINLRLSYSRSLRTSNNNNRKSID